MKNKLRQFWPLIFIMCLWVIFSHPYLFKGRIPFPSDYLVDFFPPWNNYYGLPVKNNAMPDVITQIYPWKHITIESWLLKQIPRWNPYQFSGTPHLANVQSAVFSPFNILFFILSFIDAWSIFVLLQPLLAGIFTYLFLQELNLSKTASLLGSISFMFCGFITVWMAYGTLGYAILFLPLLLFAIHKYFFNIRLLYPLIIIFSVYLTVVSGHFQTSCYVIITGVLYLCLQYFLTKDVKRLTVCLIGIVLGIAVSFPQIVPSMRFYQQAVRSGLFQKGEIIPWNYLPTFIAPDFFGNPVTRNDWFGHYAEWASYIGVIPFILGLFPIALRRVKNQNVIFFFILALLSVFLAYPTAIGELVLRLKIPVISTSAFSRIIVLTSFSLSILSAFGLDLLKEKLEKHDDKKQVYLYLIAWLFVVFGVWFLLIQGNVAFVKHIDETKIGVARRNFILPTLLVFSFIAICVLGYRLKKKHRIVIVLGIIILCAFDMLRFSMKWMPFDPRNHVYPKVPILEHLRKHAGLWRVFGNFGNEGQSMFGLYGIEGYDPLYIRRYGEFIRACSDGKLHTPERSVVLLDKQGKYTKKCLDLLSVRYFFHSKGDGKNIWVFPFWKYPESFGNSPVASDEKYELYENTSAYPRAFISSDFRVGRSQEEIISLLFNTWLDLSKTVVLEKEPTMITQNIKDSGKAIVQDKVSIMSYTPNKIDLEVSVAKPSIVFMSDVYYPGWDVYINGEKSEIYRADYAFRAIVVPEGVSAVRFIYEDWFL